MRNTDELRATFHQSRQKALAQADTALAAEAVRLEANAIATVTDWPEYGKLADNAAAKERELEGNGSADHASRLPPADTSDINHE